MTSQLLSQNGLEILVNTNYVDITLVIGCILSGGICSGIMGLLIYVIPLWPDIPFDVGAIALTLAFVYGVSITAIATEVIEAGVCATLVSYAEDPKTVKSKEPALAAAIEDISRSRV